MAARAEKSAREEARREVNGSSSSSIEARKTAWASTGIVGMRNAGATEMDDAVFELGERVRVVDAAGNALTSVPAAIARLTNLTRLTLRENALRGDGVPWSSFASLRALTFLDLSGTAWTRTPPTRARVRVASHAVAGAVWFVETFTGDVFPIVTKLRHVSVAENALETLPKGSTRMNSSKLSTRVGTSTFVESPTRTRNSRIYKVLTSRGTP